MVKHSLRLARMARMDLAPNPPHETDGEEDPDASRVAEDPAIPHARHNGERPNGQIPSVQATTDDETPTERIPVIRPEPFAGIEAPTGLLVDDEDPDAADLPGSAGEHLLQQAYGTRARAQKFYDDQLADQLNDEMVEFIGRMEMAFIATADARGEADCSLRAGPPGFMQVLDNSHVAYPEYRGNGVLASLGNISENPHVGIMLLDFVRDRIGLHINGRAMIVEDDMMRAEFPGLPEEPVRGRRAERWVLVEIDEAYIHCRKHIPAMQRVPAEQAWGTDDVKRKGGDYFGVRADRRAVGATQRAAVGVPATPPTRSSR